jgi:hypothetical protein
MRTSVSGSRVYYRRASDTTARTLEMVSAGKPPMPPPATRTGRVFCRGFMVVSRWGASIKIRHSISILIKPMLRPLRGQTHGLIMSFAG